MTDPRITQLARAIVGPTPSDREQGDPALLGFSPGSYMIAVAGAPGKVWVRPQSGGTTRTAVQALNTAGVQLIPDLPVRIRQIGNLVRVISVDSDKIQGQLPVPTAEPGSGGIEPVSARRIKPGLVHAQKDPTTGTPGDPTTWVYSLNVYMEVYSYRWDGVDKYWPGGWIDLTSAVPTTSAYQCWAKVCLDPATNTAVVLKGDEKPLQALTRDDLNGIDASDYTPHAGIMLSYGQTQVNDERTFEDIRPWWTGIGASPLSGGTGWDVDAEPETPSAYDDEFNDASFNAKWTEYDPGARQTITEAGETVTLSQATQTVAYLTGARQACPAGDFTYAIKVRFSHDTTDAAGELIAGGIGVWEDAADTAKPAFVCGFGAYDASASLPTAYSGFGYAQFTAHDTVLVYAFTGDFDVDTWYYLRLRRDGALYYLDWSDDGTVWTTLNMTTAISGLAAVGHVGLAMTNKNLGATFEVEVEFFRYRDVPDGTTDPVYGQSVDARRFTGLLDAPHDYTGEAGQFVAVKTTETGLEFVDPPVSGITVKEVDGTPNVTGVTTVRVPNGSLTDDSGGQVTVDLPTAFTDLSDVPGSYSGQGGKVVKVNVGETALEFVAGGTGDMLKSVYDADDDGTVDDANATEIVTVPVADDAADHEVLAFVSDPYWSGSEPNTEEGPASPVTWTGQYNHYYFNWYVDFDLACKITGGTFTVVGGRNFTLKAFREATEIATSNATYSAGSPVTLTFNSPAEIAPGETIKYQLYQDNDSDFAYLNASTWDGDVTHWHTGDWGCGPIGHIDFTLPSSLGTMEWEPPVLGVSVADVSNPPTDAQLDTAFGTPATVGAGFARLLDDAGGHANEYLIWSDGANWWYATGTKAT